MNGDFGHECFDLVMNPRFWTKEMHDAWHSNLPDTQKAFEELRNATEEAVAERWIS